MSERENPERQERDKGVMRNMWWTEDDFDHNCDEAQALSLVLLLKKGKSGSVMCFIISLPLDLCAVAQKMSAHN